MLRWDVFCRVVDNLGDIGTCWRLARQLALEYSIDVRLWVDRLDTFANICPSIQRDISQQWVGPVEIRRWTSPLPVGDAADVVVEAFACELPREYVTGMAERSRPPVWINLEYLSAENWVEGCHGLPSPHPTLPLTKYFFFPGFTAATGGLVRERNLIVEQTAFDAKAELDFWANLGIPPRQSKEDPVNQADGDELRVCIFCYENPALTPLLQFWSEGDHRVRVLATPGVTTEQVGRFLGRPIFQDSVIERGALVVHAIPFLPQSVFDHLLWSCDLNFVRGEDSFVRAQWAKRPFVWQIYPQNENAHQVKLEVFLARYLEMSTIPDVVRKFWLAWNGIGDVQSAWIEFVRHRKTIQQNTEVWCDHLDRIGNLADNLVSFVRGKYSLPGRE